MRLSLCSVVLTVWSTVLPAWAAESSGETDSIATDRVIVRWTEAGKSNATRLQKASQLSGYRLVEKHAVTDSIEVLHLPRSVGGNELDALIERLGSDPLVAYASPDLRRHAHAVTSDPLLPSQWYLLSEQPAATRTELAWDITTGNATLIVAVLDTGVRPEHPDLTGKLLPGYDFILRPGIANDGDARDPDPSDPGDWVDADDRTQPEFSDCEIASSSWHGTRVSGLIGASTNNAAGVAGAAYNTRVLPVRVLGKCGGFDSDILVAMRWAAGISVAGVPVNPNPAQVINLSLGGDGPCTAAYQDAVDEVTARGALVVASVGNDGGPVSAPGNCRGVLGVAGIRHVGTKVGFSNLGPEVAIAAPGGNCVNTGPGQACLFSIIVATNSGTTTPLASTYTDQQRFNVGTSFSAPQAAAAAALMRSVNSRLSPAQLMTLIKQSAMPFPVNSAVPTCRVPIDSADLQTTECTCTTQTCGSGMLNTGAAVAAAQRPFAILGTSGAVVTGATVNIDAAASFASNGRTLSTFQWSIENLTGTAPVIAAASEATTTLQITGTSDFRLRLTVTDDQGGQDSETVQLSTPPAPPPATPAPPPRNGGGGGGTIARDQLFALALLALWLRRRPRWLRQPQ